MWVRTLGGEDLLEKVMASHSSNLAGRMPWTEEPGRLQSMGCKESDITERLYTHTMRTLSISAIRTSCQWKRMVFVMSLFGLA